MVMKLYAVVFDSYNDCLGADVNLFGIYETKQKAIERVEHLRKTKSEKHIHIPDENRFCIRMVVLNEDCEMFLGGYVE